MAKITIIDYGSGNLQSVFNAFELVAGDCDIKISNQIEDLRSASHLVLPGVGSFQDCMKGLKNSGLQEEIINQVQVDQKPFFGICVGMQVLASFGLENGKAKGLDLISGEVSKIEEQENLKVPHMGWNNVRIDQNNHSLLAGVDDGEHFYFANSYHFKASNQDQVIAHVNYGDKISAIIAKDNIFGCQFHPEKSGRCGLRIVKNFSQWKYPS